MAQKVAIVEDDPAISQMYEFKFKKEGYEVRIAHNGKEGLELVEKWQPDIILLDLLMPEMTGEEMLKELRKTDWGADMKVIILTNVSDQEAPHYLKDYGVKDFIVKANMTNRQVVEIVQRVLAE